MQLYLLLYTSSSKRMLYTKHMQSCALYHAHVTYAVCHAMEIYPMQIYIIPFTLHK